MACRQRDVFPLPVPRSSFEDIPRGCRSVRRRVLRKSHNEAWFSDGVQTLNELSGAPFSNPPLFCHNASQAKSLEILKGAYSSVPAPPLNVLPAGAFAELCGSSSRYTLSDSGKTVSYDREQVSWPPECSAPVPLPSVLEGGDLDFVANWETRLLRPASERSDILNSPKTCKLYLEPILIHKTSVYAEFIKRLHNRGMLTFRRGGIPIWGYFSSRRSQGSRVLYLIPDLLISFFGVLRERACLRLLLFVM